MNSHQARRILLTRQELYARVWSMPLRQLAREFGISDVAIGRMCRRRNIPCPPPGYWAKLRAGRPPPQPLLPPPQGRVNRPALFTVSPTRQAAPAQLCLLNKEVQEFSLDRLLAASAEWEQWDRLHRYLEACERQWQRTDALTPPRCAWLAWARRELARMPRGFMQETSFISDEPRRPQRTNLAAASA
jgi:hypothetical protein